MKKVSYNTIKEWYNAGITFQGHWTNPVFELFSLTVGGTPTHVHIYIENDKEGNTLHRIFDRVPTTVKTYSLNSDCYESPKPFTCYFCGSVDMYAHCNCDGTFCRACGGKLDD